MSSLFTISRRTLEQTLRHLPVGPSEPPSGDNARLNGGGGRTRIYTAVFKFAALPLTVAFGKLKRSDGRGDVEEEHMLLVW